MRFVDERPRQVLHGQDCLAVGPTRYEEDGVRDVREPGGDLDAECWLEVEQAQCARRFEQRCETRGDVRGLVGAAWRLWLDAFELRTEQGRAHRPALPWPGRGLPELPGVPRGGQLHAALSRCSTSRRVAANS